MLISEREKSPIATGSNFKLIILQSRDNEIQSNLFYVTFQGNIEIESHKTRGR